MSLPSRAQFWETRFAATDAYVFGEEPNEFLVSQSHRVKRGARVLAVADGEGRNGVFLASLGAKVHATDISPTAIAKSRQLAAARGATLTWEQADVTNCAWPEGVYDVVAAIFVQFVTPLEQPEFFTNLQRALKPGGVLLLQGYRPEQLTYNTGGPKDAAQLYTETQLRAAFAGMTIEQVRAHDDVINEGDGHAGLSALIDLIATRPGEDA